MQLAPGVPDVESKGSGREALDGEAVGGDEEAEAGNGDTVGGDREAGDGDGCKV